MSVESEIGDLKCPKEDIPDNDFLFRHVHKNLIHQGTLARGVVFKNHGDGMSTDWSKYSNVQQTRNRVKLNNKNPTDYGVIKLNVKEVRNIEEQVVEHNPLNENRAHTLVKGDKTEKTRVLFGRIYKWAIEPPVI